MRSLGVPGYLLKYKVSGFHIVSILFEQRIYVKFTRVALLHSRQEKRTTKFFDGLISLDDQ